MAQYIQRLREEHANIVKLIDAFDQQIAVFSAGGTPDYDLMIAALDYLQSFAARFHHPKEDLVYSRMCERDPDAAARVGDLIDQHDQLAALGSRFAGALQIVIQEGTVARDWFVAEAGHFLQTQRAHMEAEERTLFSAALAALTQQDWADLATQAEDGADPLFGPEADDRFALLRRHIEELSAAPY